MPKLLNKRNINRILKRRNNRQVKKFVLKNPTSERESDNERRNEEIQQSAINKEMEEVKKGVEDIRAFMNDDLIKKKMEELLRKLPKDDKLRNIIDEDRKIVNDNKAKSSLKIKLL